MRRAPIVLVFALVGITLFSACPQHAPLAVRGEGGAGGSGGESASATTMQGVGGGGATVGTGGSGGGDGGMGGQGGEGSGTLAECMQFCTTLYECSVEVDNGEKRCPGFTGEGLEFAVFLQMICLPQCNAAGSLQPWAEGVACSVLVPGVSDAWADFKKACADGLSAL